MHPPPADVSRSCTIGPAHGPAPVAKIYSHQPAEDAWVEIYEFLGKHVEDASSERPRWAFESGSKPVATIADMMRAVNDPGRPPGTPRT